MWVKDPWQEVGTMQEHDSGEGRLVSLEADQNEYFVEYELDIDTQTSGSGERFEPLRVVKHYRLQVKPMVTTKFETVTTP
jgi:hypothetical protein